MDSGQSSGKLFIVVVVMLQEGLRKENASRVDAVLVFVAYVWFIDFYGDRGLRLFARKVDGLEIGLLSYCLSESLASAMFS